MKKISKNQPFRKWIGELCEGDSELEKFVYSNHRAYNVLKSLFFNDQLQKGKSMLLEIHEWWKSQIIPFVSEEWLARNKRN